MYKRACKFLVAHPGVAKRIRVEPDLPSFQPKKKTKRIKPKKAQSKSNEPAKLIKVPNPNRKQVVKPTAAPKTTPPRIEPTVIRIIKLNVPKSALQPTEQGKKL